jgi:hypothetical protein
MDLKHVSIGARLTQVAALPPREPSNRLTFPFPKYIFST